MDNETVLYPVLPIGIGRWDCEGVVSYLCRLADLHRVAVDDLVNRCLAVCCGYNFRIWRHFSWWSRNPSVSVFTKDRTDRLTNALVLATGVTEVARLSLSGLSSALDLRGTAAHFERHCPKCVCEMPYPAAFRPLLWDIGIVTACPRHGIRLVTSACGSPPELHLSLWSRRQVAGICTTCGKLGLKCANVGEDKATSEELWLAKNAGDVISAVSAGETFSFECVRKGVVSMAQRIGNGRPYRAAFVCGFSKARLFDWIKGRRLIKFAPFMALCAASGSDVLSALRGEPNVAGTSTFRYSCHEKLSVYPQIMKREERVRAALKDTDCPSLASVARSLSIHRTTLEREFPEEARLLIERFKQKRSAATATRRTAAKAAIERAVAALQLEGRPVSRRNIYLESGMLVTNGSRVEQILLELGEQQLEESHHESDNE
jgi:hypothetical protein